MDKIVSINIAGWLACFAFLVVLWNGVRKAIDREKDGSNKTTVISPQPLVVDIAKELHEKFADKAIFEKHVENNTARHGQIFGAVSKVEKEAREAMDRRFETLNQERSVQLKNLNDKFEAIGKEVSSLQATTTLQNQSLARIENKLDRK